MGFSIAVEEPEGRRPRASWKGQRGGYDSYVAEMDRWTVAESEETDLDEDGPYEDFLERAQMDWGELYEDDRMWTLDDSIEGYIELVLCRRLWER